MTLRWVDDDENVTETPSHRAAFYRQIEKIIRQHDATVQVRIENELRAWLDEVSSGNADYASVHRNAGSDWNGYERQAIYDATQDWNQSRWWCGLLLMKLAIEHNDRFVGYKPGDPDSEVSTAYFLDRRSAHDLTQVGFLAAVAETIDVYEWMTGRAATRTRQMIEEHGEVRALSRLMIRGDLQQGFRVLRDNGQLERTFEALVVRFSDLFPAETVQAARWRLRNADELEPPT